MDGQQYEACVQERSKRPHLGLTLSLTSETFSRARLWNNLALAGCTVEAGGVHEDDVDQVEQFSNVANEENIHDKYF